MKIKTVEAGDYPYYNEGAPVMVFEGSGSIYINELKCLGLGSCLQLKDGILAANINKISTLVFDPESPATTSTILLPYGTGDPELVLYFDEIKNLNPNGADCVTILKGKASLIGRRIYSESSKTIIIGDVEHTIDSAYIQCDEIVSLLEGINIWNSTEPTVIDAKYIQGGGANAGVIKCNDTCNLVLRNAKIVNMTESTSIGIYITNNSTGQLIELENLIIVAGLNIGDFSIFRAGSTNINIKNLLLFVNKPISDHITLQIGNSGNFKYIEDNSIV